MASKAKNLRRRCTFLGLGGGGEIGVRDIAPPSLGNLGAKLSETAFPHFKTYSTQIKLLSQDNNLKPLIYFQ